MAYFEPRLKMARLIELWPETRYTVASTWGLIVASKDQGVEYMKSAGGMIIFRMNGITEILVGIAKRGRFAGKRTICFVTLTPPGETNLFAAMRAAEKETGSGLVLGTPKRLHTFDPTVYETKLEVTPKGKIVGVCPTDRKLCELGTVTEVFYCDCRTKTTYIKIPDTADVRGMEFLSILEVNKRWRELAYNQPEMLWELQRKIG